MKTISIINARWLASLTLLVVLLAQLAAPSAFAASVYTWTQTAGGAQSWATGGNWSGGSAPSPVSTDTVDFSTVNIVADTTLTLEADRTATTWKFGDTSGTQNWTINSGNKIILAGTTPGFNVVQNTVTLNNVVDGTAGLLKTGAGTLTLGAANTFTVGPTLNAGTLQISGSGTLGNTANTLTLGGSGTVNLGGTSQTLGNIAVTVGGTVLDTLNNGSLTLSAASDLLLTTPASPTTAGAFTLDASGLSNLTISKSANALTVGGNSAATAAQTGTLKLSAVNNDITAATLNVGTAGGTGAIINGGTLSLGAANAIKVTTVAVGSTRANANLSFQTGLTSPTVSFRGVAGGANPVTSFTVGNNAAGGTAGNTQVADFSLGSLDARVTTLAISRGASGSPNFPSVNGTFTMGAGTLNATSILISDNTSGGGNTPNTGILNQNAGMVTVATLTLGQRVGAAAAPQLLPSYNLGTATLAATLKAQTIQAGAGTVATTTVRKVNFNNGTIQNYDSATDLTINGTGTAAESLINVILAATGTHSFSPDASRTITVGANTVISGSGSLSKDGSGTLSLLGANTYTGGTIINNGTLKISAGSLGNTAISFGGTAVLAVQPGSATTINFGNTATAAAGATLSMGANNTFDMTDGAISTCNLQQESTFAGAALTLATGANLKFNLGNSTCDLLAVTKAASVSGTINVTVDTTTATSWTGNPTFTIITAASGLNSGTWTLANSTATVGGKLYNLSIANTATAVTVTATHVTYSVTYNNNSTTFPGATGSQTDPTAYENNATVTVLDKGSMALSGYAFSGWNTLPDGTGTSYGPGATFAITGNTTLYAQWLLGGPVISTSGTLAAVDTTYGTASPSPTSFSVSGINITGGILVTAPAGYEVSQTLASGFGPTTTVAGSGTIGNTTIYVRLAATTGFGTYSGNVVCSSALAATVPVATAASTVSKYALTLTGATAQNKVYDGTTAATITGGTLSTTVNGDVITATTGTFAQATAGSGIAVSVILSGAAAGNYTLTDPGLSATIFASPTWVNTAGGVWDTSGNWVSSIIGDGSGVTADFSQLNITSDTTVSLNSARTIGNIVFGDTDTGTAAGWTLDNNSTPANVLTLAGSTPTITVNALGGTSTATISAVVAGTTLAKSGVGPLTLSGANTYTGVTTVNAGTLAAGSATAFGPAASASLVFGPGTSTGKVQLKDYDITVIGLNSDATPGTPVVESGSGSVGTSVLTVNNASGSTFAGVIQNGSTRLLGVTKSGAGTLTLSGANSYSGGTIISGGALIANNSSALGTAGISIGSSAVRLVINDGFIVANDITINNSTGASGRGLIENSGAGNATLSGGTITINGGPSAGGNFAAPSSGTLTIADPINASVPFSQRLGTVIYSGGGSYANMLVTGTARLGADNGLSTSATLDLGASGTASLDLAGYNQSLAGINRSTGSSTTVGNSSTINDSLLTLTGASLFPGVIQNVIGAGSKKVAVTVNGGTHTLSGANTFSGNTTISAGKLVGSTAGSCANSTVAVAAAATNGVLLAAANGQWTCAGLTYAAGFTCADFDFTTTAPSTTVAPLKINGNLTVNGTVNVIVRRGSSLAAGTYPLFTWTGTGPTDLSGLGPVTLPSGMPGTLALNSATKTISVVAGIKVPNLVYTNASSVNRQITVADIQAAGLASSQSTPVYSITLPSATSSAGGSVITSGSIILYEPPAGSPGSDSFSYTISDGVVAATATVSIAFEKQAGGSQPQLAVSGGAVSGTLYGIPGVQYDIQRKTNISDTVWQTLASPPLSNAPPYTAGSDGSISFTDTNPPPSSGYYRTIQH